MKYFVLYDAGRCTDGDHESGWGCFGTEAEARVFAEKFESEHVCSEGTAYIVRGELVRLP